MGDRIWFRVLFVLACTATTPVFASRHARTGPAVAFVTSRVAHGAGHSPGGLMLRRDAADHLRSVLPTMRARATMHLEMLGRAWTPTEVRPVYRCIDKNGNQ